MCALIMNNSVKILSFVLLVCVLYTLYLYLRDLYKNRHTLTLDKIKALESIVGHAVNLSEQLYKKDGSIDRFKNAFDVVLEMTSKLGINKKLKLDNLITTLIESNVLKLPKTK